MRKPRSDCTVGSFERKHGLPAGTREMVEEEYESDLDDTDEAEEAEEELLRQYQALQREHEELLDQLRTVIEEEPASM